MNKGDLVEFYYRKGNEKKFTPRKGIIVEARRNFVKTFTEEGFRTFRKRGMVGVITHSNGPSWHGLVEAMAKTGYQL